VVVVPSSIPPNPRSIRAVPSMFSLSLPPSLPVSLSPSFRVVLVMAPCSTASLLVLHALFCYQYCCFVVARVRAAALRLHCLPAAPVPTWLPAFVLPALVLPALVLPAVVWMVWCVLVMAGGAVVHKQRKLRSNTHLGV